MVNRKGVEMAISTIVVIVLALIVLVFLVYGFSVGWGNLFDKISNFGGGQSNVQTIVQSCEIACATGAEFDYCKLERDVKFGGSGGLKDSKYNCKALEGKNFGLANCNAFGGTCVANPSADPLQT